MKDRLTELRRRNVFRVAAACRVVAWILIQVVGVVRSNRSLSVRRVLSEELRLECRGVAS